MEKILNENKMLDLKENDAIFQVELQSENGNMNIISHKLIFVKYLDKKIRIEGLDTNEDSVLAELYNEATPKIPIKTDISCGYFKSEKEAYIEFVNMTKEIYEVSLKEYETKFHN
jgi:hypothetical protein